MDNRTELIVRLWNDSRRYFQACVAREHLLVSQDVDDLASDIIVAVIPRLDGLRAPDRYVRRMARNRVVRELKHRRATQGRMCPLEEQDGLPDPDTSSLQESVGMDGGMGDRAERAVRTARFVLREEDEVTRMMVSARCASPPRTFSEISATTGVSSSALRMRMTRFTRRVRSVLPPDVDQGCPGNPFGKESCAPGGRTPDENLEVPSCSLKVR